jgi:hypothetical protein
MEHQEQQQQLMMNYAFPHHPYFSPPGLQQAAPSSVLVSVRLGASKEHADCNADLTLKTIVKKDDSKTVAEFSRDIVSHSAPDWILKLVRRHSSMQKRTKSNFVLSFGGGHDLLVLLDGADVPKDLTRVTRASVGLTISAQELPNDEQRILACHNDGIWDHVEAVANTSANRQVMIVLSSSDNKPYGAHEGFDNRVKMIRLWTQQKSLFHIARIDHSQDGLQKQSAASRAAQPSGDPPVSDEEEEPQKRKVAAILDLGRKPSVETALAVEGSKSPSPELVKDKAGPPEALAPAQKKPPSEVAVAAASEKKAKPLEAPKKAAASAKKETGKRGRPKGTKNKDKTPTKAAPPTTAEVKDATASLEGPAIGEQSSEIKTPPVKKAKRSRSKDPKSKTK